MNSVISCQNLIKNYGSKQVLKGVNLNVPTGTTFALLGTNGAGKTTLIRTLLGLIPKTHGEVRVLGEEPYKIGPQLRQRIGYVSEEQGLYSWMTIHEIIHFCRSLYDKWDNALVEKYIQRFKLDPHARIGTLSKGQEVKLALLLSLAPQPELLILDEPMSGLDPLAQHEFLQVIMRDINLEGRTIFFSTHNLADAEVVAQQVAIIYNGVIKAVGPLNEICRRITKVKLNTQDLPDSLNQAVIVNESNTERDILIPSESWPEIAATTELNVITNSVATLEEAFLFYCSGGEEL